jgi:hypothetical protein
MSVLFFSTKIKPRVIYVPLKMWRLSINRTVNIPRVIKWGKSIPYDAPVRGQVTRTHLSFRVKLKNSHQLRVRRKMAASA